MYSSTITIDSIFSLTQRRSLSNAIWIGVFSLLTAAGAQILIPTVPVPFTLQTFFVLLSGALLGARKGAISQIAYLMMGTAGLPVFAGFSGTFAPLLGPTGGYLLAFPVAAYITGYLLHDVRAIQALPRMAAGALAMIVAMAALFTMGVVHLNFILIQNWKESIAAGFVAMQLWDAVKIIAAAGIYAEIGRRYAK